MNYRSRLREHVLSVLKEGPLSFDQVIAVAEGAYPTEVRKVLIALASEGLVSENSGSFCAGSKSANSEIGHLGRDGLLISGLSLADPHPADYDWRFSSSTVWDLVRLIRRIAPQDAGVGLLGAGTLLPVLSSLGTNVTLFERNKALISDLGFAGLGSNVVEADLFNPIAGWARTCDIVVADPPWYPAYYSAFLLRAAELLKMEGVLILSMLPRLTRPTAARDRTKATRFALRVGFGLQEALPRAIRYDTPRFEKMSLLSDGITCGRWRTADRYSFRKVHDPPEGIVVARPKDEVEWDDFRIGARRIKLRQRADANEGRFDFWPVYEDSPTIRSVSRRAPYRSKIDVWTSDNLAYSVSGTDVLREALSLIQGGEPEASAVKQAGLAHKLPSSHVGRLCQLVNELLGEISREKDEKPMHLC